MTESTDSSRKPVVEAEPTYLLDARRLISGGVVLCLLIWAMVGGDEGSPRLALDRLALAACVATAMALVLHGWAIFRSLVILNGVVIGLVAGLLGAVALDAAHPWLLAVLMALACGVLAWPLQRFLVYVQGAFWGGLTLLLLTGWGGAQGGALVVASLAGGLVGGALALRLHRLLVTVGLALSGASLIHSALHLDRFMASPRFRWLGFETTVSTLRRIAVADPYPAFALGFVMVCFALWFQRSRSPRGGAEDSVRGPTTGQVRIVHVMAGIALLQVALWALPRLGFGTTRGTWAPSLIIGVSMRTWPLNALVAIALVPLIPRWVARIAAPEVRPVVTYVGYGLAGMLCTIGVSAAGIIVMQPDAYAGVLKYLSAYMDSFTAGPTPLLVMKAGWSLAVLPLILSWCIRSTTGGRRDPARGGGAFVAHVASRSPAPVPRRASPAAADSWDARWRAVTDDVGRGARRGRLWAKRHKRPLIVAVLITIGLLGTFGLALLYFTTPLVEPRRPPPAGEASPEDAGSGSGGPTVQDIGNDPTDPDRGGTSPAQSCSYQIPAGMTSAALDRAVVWMSDPVKGVCGALQTRLAMRLGCCGERRGVAAAVARFQAVNSDELPDAKAGPRTLTSLFGKDVRWEVCPGWAGPAFKSRLAVLPGTEFASADEALTLYDYYLRQATQAEQRASLDELSTVLRRWAAVCSRSDSPPPPGDFGKALEYSAMAGGCCVHWRTVQRSIGEAVAPGDRPWLELMANDVYPLGEGCHLDGWVDYRRAAQRLQAFVDANSGSRYIPRVRRALDLLRTRHGVTAPSRGHSADDEERCTSRASYACRASNGNILWRDSCGRWENATKQRCCTGCTEGNSTCPVAADAAGRCPGETTCPSDMVQVGAPTPFCIDRADRSGDRKQQAIARCSQAATGGRVCSVEEIDGAVQWSRERPDHELATTKGTGCCCPCGSYRGPSQQFWTSSGGAHGFARGKCECWFENRPGVPLASTYYRCCADVDSAQASGQPALRAPPRVDGSYVIEDFLGIGGGDRLRDAAKILGPPTNARTEGGEEWYEDATFLGGVYVGAHIFGGITVRLTDLETVAALRRRGVEDPKMDYLGRTRTELLRLLGEPQDTAGDSRIIYYGRGEGGLKSLDLKFEAGEDGKCIQVEFSLTTA